jgi:hypothetical protein
VRVLLQTRVRSAAAKKLDELVAVRGCTRSSYLAILVEEHVRDLDVDTLRRALTARNLQETTDSPEASR